MEDSRLVQAFFNKRASQFDSYYHKEKPLRWRLLDFLFRRSMTYRFGSVLEECRKTPPVKIIDIGCGSGRYTVALAKEGFEVLGIDFSSQMLNIAHQLAKEDSVYERCRFILGDFKEMTFTERFSVALAIGIFDYIKSPYEYLKKMREITTERIIVTFPAKWRCRNMVRIIRLRILNCPVYFYTRADIGKLFQSVGINNYRIKNLDRDYFVVADLK